MTLQKDPERNEIRYLRQCADFSGKRVLEVGCGEGRMTWQYAKETHTTIGIDPERDLLILRGAVPGANGSLILVREAVKA